MTMRMLITIIGPAIAIALVTALIVFLRARRAPAKPFPACGRCGYDVSATVAEADRCPECGTPFIEAGIIPPSVPPVPIGRLVLVIGAIVLALFGGLFALRLGTATLARNRAPIAAPPPPPAPPPVVVPVDPSSAAAPSGAP